MDMVCTMTIVTENQNYEASHVLTIVTIKRWHFRCYEAKLPSGNMEVNFNNH